MRVKCTRATDDVVERVGLAPVFAGTQEVFKPQHERSATSAVTPVPGPPVAEVIVE